MFQREQFQNYVEEEKKMRKNITTITTTASMPGNGKNKGGLNSKIEIEDNFISKQKSVSVLHRKNQSVIIPVGSSQAKQLSEMVKNL